MEQWIAKKCPKTILDATCFPDKACSLTFEASVIEPVSLAFEASELCPLHHWYYTTLVLFFEYEQSLDKYSIQTRPWITKNSLPQTGIDPVLLAFKASVSTAPVVPCYTLLYTGGVSQP